MGDNPNTSSTEAASASFRSHVGLDNATKDDDGNVVLPEVELEPSDDEKDDDKDDAKKAPAKKSSSKKD